METDPLVNSESQMHKYVIDNEDGSSILNPNPVGLGPGGGSGSLAMGSSTIEPLSVPVVTSNLNPTTGPVVGVGGNKAILTDSEKSSLNLLEKFHEDALQQIGHGKVQLIVLLVCGLIVSADLSELMALILSSKSAQFEFCVDDTQKSWIVGASLIGLGVGAGFTGSLGDRLGRRRALLYSLGFSAIFSGASVIMPTEGTFLTSRLFSGMGLGGSLVLAPTYLSEFIQEKKRRLATSILFLFWPLGASYVIMLSWLLLPSTGFHLSEELKEHFSAWRRLLLASAAPTFLSVLLLIFMPEGPLNLMQNGRDAEALAIYKDLYKWNRGPGTNFCLSEVEIPTLHSGTPTNSPQPRNVIGDFQKAFESFWESFQMLWTKKRKQLTITLTLIWFIAALGQGALTSWVISLQASLRDWTFDKGATFLQDLVITDRNITKDIVNVRYRRSTFINVSIQNLMMNHVKFENCTFDYVNFTNVRASYVLFTFSNLTDCYFVDSDLGRSNFKNSVMENITYAGSDPSCHLIPDFNMELANDMLDSGLPVLGIFIGALISLAFVHSQSRTRLVSVYLILSALVSIGLTIWKLDPTWAIVGHTIINVLVAGMWSILIGTFDKYPSVIRSGALGIGLAAGRLGSFFGVGLFGTTLQGIIVPIFSSIFLCLAACLAFRSRF